MKTKRRYLRLLKRHTQKLLKHRQKGGVGTILKTLGKLGLGALALGVTPQAMGFQMNARPQPSSTALMAYPGASYGPTPSYSTSLMSYGNSFASPSYTGSMNLAQYAAPTYSDANMRSVLASPSYSATNMKSVMATPQFSATPSQYMTPPAMPGAVASVAEPVHKILQDASIDFLKGTLGPVTKEMVNEALAPKKMSEGIVIAGHNTLTTSTARAPIVGTPLVSVNQILTLDQYLDRCATTGRCFLDLDMWMVNGQVKSTHGGPMPLGFEKVLNTSEGSRGTQAVLQKIHAYAQSHPDVTFMIRSENHNVSAKDITGMLTPEMKSQVASFSKFNVPTQGELVERGTNVMYFLENNNQAAVDQSTGIYTDSVVMAQDHFMVRTNWDDIKGLTSAQDINKHMSYNASLLGSSPIFLIDGYNTLIAANTSPEAFDAQTQFVAQVPTNILPRMKAAAAANGVQNTEDAGCVIMMDFVNDGSFAYQVSLNLKETIQDPEVKLMVEQEVIPAFIQAQQMIAPSVTGASQRGFINSFYAAFQGKPLSSVDKGRFEGVAIGGVALVLFFYLMGRRKKLAQKKGETSLANKITTELKQDIDANPEVGVYVRKGEESVKESDTSLLNDNPSASMGSFSPPNSPRTEPTTPGPNNEMPALESSLTKTQKKRLKKKERESRKENNAFLRWGQGKRGGKTRRRR